MNNKEPETTIKISKDKDKSEKGDDDEKSNSQAQLIAEASLQEISNLNK